MSAMPQKPQRGAANQPRVQPTEHEPEPEPTPTPEEKPEDVEAKETREEGTVKSETEDHASATGEEDNDQASQPDHIEQVESSIETKAQKDALTCCGVTIDVA